MNLELLKRFYVVAEEGTIGKAAQKLNVVPSALTRSIGDFEYQLKTQLFDRVPKGMRLTPQGERLYIYARKLIKENEAFEREFLEKTNEFEGEIKIITTPFLGAEWLVQVLKDFLEEHPKINIRIVVKDEDINVSEGDIAICAFIPHQPHLIQELLFSSYIHLFAGENYIKKFGEPQTVKDLDYHKLITYREDNYYSLYGSTTWILNVGNDKKENIRKPYFEINSLHGMINAALQGFGIVELPDHFPVLKSGLKKVLPNIYGAKIDIFFVFQESRRKSKKISLLLEYLRNSSTFLSEKNYLLEENL